jgi:hypothetical protein
MFTLERRIRIALSAFLSLLLVAANQRLFTLENPQSPSSIAHPVQVAMRNVEYHYTPDTSVRILFLHGELYPTRPPQIVIFDDRTSFFLAMAYSQISMTCNALANILNQHVFAAADAPIKSVSIQSKGSALIIRGKLHQKGNISFETTGTISPTPDGRIRLHAEKVTAAHLPVKGLMDLLGLDIATLINTNKVRGVAVEKDDILLDPREFLPLPRIQGKVTAVQIQGNEIIETFGNKQDSHFDPVIAGNYMAYRGNELRFGKLTMHDTDMVLLDMDPQDPFDFFLDHYNDQVVAGYSKTTPSFGLRVYMRDYNKLKRAAERPAASSNPGGQSKK